jgi:hypothetical protein
MSLRVYSQLYAAYELESISGKVQKPSQVLSGGADTFPRNRIAYAAFSESKRRLPLFGGTSDRGKGH